jgi:hypothetical protein
MASQQQIDANRRNSQKSTGPKTPEGRAAVRLNGVKHGLTASTLVLKGEEAVKPPPSRSADPKLFKNSNDSGQFAYVAMHDAKDLAAFSIYEARLERTFYKALRELQRIRAQRQAEMKNQTQIPIPDTPAATPNAPFLVPDPPVPANCGMLRG